MNYAICKKDYDIYAKKDEVFIIEYERGYFILKSESRIGSITIINKTFKEHFITLAEYRDIRIDEILE